jgi:hypothetical protein
VLGLLPFKAVNDVFALVRNLKTINNAIPVVLDPGVMLSIEPGDEVIEEPELRVIVFRELIFIAGSFVVMVPVHVHVKFVVPRPDIVFSVVPDLLIVDVSDASIHVHGVSPDGNDTDILYIMHTYFVSKQMFFPIAR